MTAFVLQQLLALYFEIIYSSQLSSFGTPLVGKKISSINLKDFTDLDFFFSFSLTNACLPYQSRKA